MKIFFKQLMAVICAVYFLAAGLGINIVQYCCESCAHAGIEAVASQSCETIHHDNEQDCSGHACTHHQPVQQNDDMACSDINHEADGCHIWRIQTDTPSVDVMSNFSYADYGISIDFPIAVLSLLTESYVVTTEQDIFTPPDKIPLYTGRDILAHHAVLLI